MDDQIFTMNRETNELSRQINIDTIKGDITKRQIFLKFLEGISRLIYNKY